MHMISEIYQKTIQIQFQNALMAQKEKKQAFKQTENINTSNALAIAHLSSTKGYLLR